MFSNVKIETVDGEYVVHTYMHHTKFTEARAWCRSQFGDNWGSARSGQFDRFFGSDHTFTFKRLYHAQWFLMRWNT